MQDKHWFLNAATFLASCNPSSWLASKRSCPNQRVSSGKTDLPTDRRGGSLFSIGRRASADIRCHSRWQAVNRGLHRTRRPVRRAGDFRALAPRRIRRSGRKIVRCFDPWRSDSNARAGQRGSPFGITKLIGLRRRRIERRLRGLLFRSNRQRLIHLLLELAEQFGCPTARGAQIGLKLSHQELAGVIGSTRESVTLLLGELQQERSIEITRRRIELIEPERLTKEIEFSPLTHADVHAHGVGAGCLSQLTPAARPIRSQL